MVNSWQWVIEEELEAVFARLILMYKADPQVVEGEGMAFVIKRLLASEVAVGGPYKSINGRVAPTANTIVDRFLRLSGTELPNLEPYREKIDSVTPKEIIPFTGEYQKIKSTVRAELTRLPSSVRPAAMQMWKAICGVDKKHEIGSISYFFAESLKTRKPTNKQLQKLGLANFYIWMAYTIYDDFFDDEGVPMMLPLANITMRKAFSAYSDVWEDKASDKLVAEVFTRMDEANAWEMTHARASIEDAAITLPATLPRYGKNYLLADRAFGHVLGPLLITEHQKRISTEQCNSIYEGLRQFLIVRQLNDDIHDWQKDLQAGHLSPVVVHLLEKCGFASGTYSLAMATQRLEQYFWRQGLVELCKITLGHVKKCRYALKRNQLMIVDGEFGKLIDRLESAMLASQQIHNNQKDFLKTYQKLSR